MKATAANLSLHASGLYTSSGTSRTLSINSTSTGVGPSGNDSSRTGTYTVTWTAGESCANIDGTVASVSNPGDVMSFNAFRVCTTGCPVSGTVTRTNPNGVSTTTVYDGTSAVRFTTSDGQTGVETISCP